MTTNFRYRPFIKQLVIGFFVGLAFCFFNTAHAQSGSRTTHVLFIGNSYTYFNNIPEIFALLAETRQRGNVETRMVAPGGWQLKDHWEKGDAIKALHEGKWDYVVLQDQSTLGVNYFVEGQPHVTSDKFFSTFVVGFCVFLAGYFEPPLVGPLFMRLRTIF